MKREFAVLGALAAVACSGGTRSAPSPAATPLPSAGEMALREQTADQQVRQALDRLTFGARPGDYERVRAMGVDRWIAGQLEPDRIRDTTAARLARWFPAMSASPSDLLRDYPSPQAIRAERRRDGRAGAGAGAEDSLELRRARQLSAQLAGELQAARVARAVASPRQLQEVMTDFWENHFNIYLAKGPERYYLASFDRDVIRPHALGKFRDLLGAVAHSPAMLFYLDNWESTVNPDRPALVPRGIRARPMVARPRFGPPVLAPRLPVPPRPAAAPRARQARGLNENYGRELMELHTLGVDGGYTQADVIAAAEAFTGWTIDRPNLGGGFVFRPQMHDAGEKRFLGHTLKAGRGEADGNEVLDILAASPATAHFISLELARRFVSDSPPPALVDRAAETFTRTGGDVREVLRTIFTSSEFFSRAAYKAKVKTPFELVVSALRAVGANPDSTPRTARLVAQLGQPLYMHRDPNGWPETGDAWINTGSILNRINFGLAFAAGRVPGASLPRWEQASGLDTLARAQQVDGVIGALLGGEASPDTRRVLMQGVNPLLSGALAARADSDSAAADDGAAPDVPEADSATVVRPRRRGARRDLLAAPLTLQGLGQIVGLALGAPEFQRR